MTETEIDVSTRISANEEFLTPQTPRSTNIPNGASHWAELKIMMRAQATATLLMAPGSFYVYVLCRPDGIPFYVGKGRGQRVFQHEAESWNPSRLSYKLNVIRRIRHDGGEIGYAFDSFHQNEPEAHARERALIQLYGRHDLRQGPLTNQLDGGEGASNPSAEARARHAASLGGEAEDPERRIANGFLASIAGKQDSVPIKPWAIMKRTAHLLRPSPRKPMPKPQLRMAKAIAGAALAQGVLLASGAEFARCFSIEDVACAIENGCGGDMIHAGMVESVEPRELPQQERLRLTARGLRAVKELLGTDRLLDLGLLEP